MRRAPATHRRAPACPPRGSPFGRYNRSYVWQAADAARRPGSTPRTVHCPAVTDYPQLPLPRFFRARQHLPSDHVEDVAAAVRDEVERIGLAQRLRPGASVAITAGSRGIADIPLVIRSIAEVVRAAGAEPFVVPAMGSHGGATVEGQRHILAEYGITEQRTCAPIPAT